MFEAFYYVVDYLLQIFTSVFALSVNTGRAPRAELFFLAALHRAVSTIAVNKECYQTSNFATRK